MAPKKSPFHELISKVPENTKLYDVPPVEFKDSHVDNAPNYNIPDVTEAQLSLLTVGLKSKLKPDKLDDLMVERILILAANLKEVSKTSDVSVLKKFFPTETTNSAGMKIVTRMTTQTTRQGTEQEEGYESDGSRLSEAEIRDSEVKADPRVIAAQSKLDRLKVEGTTLINELEKARKELAAIEAPPSEGTDPNEGKRAAKQAEVDQMIAEEEAKAAEVTKARQERDSLKVSVKTELKAKERAKHATRTRKPPASTPTVITPAEKKFGPFVAAYLTRLLVKSSENVTNSWIHMKDMFKRFYGLTAPDWPVPKGDDLNSIRDEMVKDRRFVATWIQIVSKADFELDPAVGEHGLVRYLAILPLSYAGLHAYKLFIEVKLQTQQTSKWILESLQCPSTEKGLLQIANILINYESTDKEKKSGKFRFARLIGPQFFQDLQTKHCPGLVYLLISLLKKYKSGKDLADPAKIAGIQTLAPELKAIMDRAAEDLVATAPSSQPGHYSEVMARAYQNKATEEEEEEEEEEIVRTASQRKPRIRLFARDTR
ncbi:TPA_asm: N [Kobresia betacytorhabdovirus 1]|nr:TPA_asm: N [Kobresia betacytorhabdovirus 1]